MTRQKRPGKEANKEQRAEKKSFGHRGKRTEAHTSSQPQPDVDSESVACEDHRPTILQVRSAELFQRFVPLVLLALLSIYIVSTSNGMARITQELPNAPRSNMPNVASSFHHQIAKISRQSTIQSERIRSLADAFRANPDRMADNGRRDAKSTSTIPELDSQLRKLRESIAAMRSQIDGLRSMMSEQEARDPYPGTWAKSQDWGIVLFNSTEGYNAKNLYPTVKEFFAAYGSTGDYSIQVIGAESQQIRLIQTAVRGEPAFKLDTDEFADPSPGTTEKPDEIVGKIVRRLEPQESKTQCLLIVSRRCPIPKSDEWQKFRVHVCVLDELNQPDELRQKWQVFCRRHGGGLCEIVSFNTKDEFGILAASGTIRGWLESALRSPPLPNQATSADGQADPFTFVSGEQHSEVQQHNGPS